jgi:hypothetical protein
VQILNLCFGLAILGLNWYGDYITECKPQANYACPKYCDVDHKHLPVEECNNGKSSKEKETRSSKRAL